MHVLAVPNGMLPFPLSTMPFCATSSASALAALKKRTVVLAIGVATGLLLSLQAASAAAVASTRTEAVTRDCTGPPELTWCAHSRPCFAVPLRTYRTRSANLFMGAMGRRGFLARAVDARRAPAALPFPLAV